MSKKIISALCLAAAINIYANDIEDINYINKLYQNRYYKESVTELEIFLKKYPSSKLYNSAQNMLAYNYFFLEKYKESKQLYERVKTTEFKDEAVYYLIAIAIKEKSADEAEKYVAEVNLKSNYGQKSYILLGDYFAAENNRKKAEEYYRGVIKSENPSKQEVLLKLAAFYYNGSEYSKTVAIGEELILRSDAKSEYMPQLYYMLAYSNNQIGQKEDAVKYYEKIIEGYKDSRYFYESINNLMVFYNNEKEYDKAFVYAAMLAGSSYDKDGAEVAARISYEKGEFSKAEELYKGVWKKYGLMEHYFRYILTLLKQGKVAETTSVIESTDVASIKENSYFSKYYYYYFYTLFAQKEYEKILKKAESVDYSRIDKEDLKDIYKIAGEAGFLSGNYEKSLGYYKKIDKDEKISARIIISSYKAKKYSESVSEFEDYQNKYGFTGEYSRDVYIAAGNSLAELEKYEQAKAVYSKYLDYKKDAIVENNLLYVLLEMRQYKEVIVAIDNMEKSEENGYIKALAYIGSGNYEMAETVLKEIIENKGSFAEKSYEKLGEMYLKVEKYGDALFLVDGYLKNENIKRENIFKMLDIQGRAFLKLNKYESAIESYSEMAKLEKYSDYAKFMMGEISYNFKNYDRAIDYYQYVVDNFPNSEYRRASYYGIININYQKGESSAAIKYGESFLKNYSNGELVEDVLYILGNITSERGENDKANNYYDRLYLISSKEEMKNNIAEIVLKNSYALKKYGDMPKWIERINNSRSKKLWDAMYLEKTGKTIEAIKNYESLIGDSEVGDRAAYYLGSYYFSTAKYDKARVYLEKVFDYMMSEYKDDALLKIGFSYDEEKNSSRAISSFMRIKLLYSDSPLQDIATLKIAENYESMGDLENAEKNYEDFYINYKNSPYYPTVTEKLINTNLKKKDLKTAYGYYRELSRLNEKRAKNYESYFKNRGEKFE